MANKMSKLNKQNVTTVGALVVTGVKVVRDVLAEADKNGTVTAAVDRTRGQLQQVRDGRDPLVRIEKQLDTAAQHAHEAQHDPDRAAQAAQWLTTIASIRSKLPVVRVEQGRARAKHVRQLRTRTTQVLQEIVTEGL